MSWQSDQARDQMRGEFLRRLDESDLDVTGFDADFIGSYLKFAEKFWWSAARRKAVDRMMERYLHLLPAKGNAAPQPARPALPDTTAGKCDYLIRPEGGGPQIRCGQPAVKRTRLGAEYCAEHRDLRAEFARRNREIQQRARRS